MTGRFITFEGCDGVGKSTQAALLRDALQAAGQNALLTREPGGCLCAEWIRDMLTNGDLKLTPNAEVLLHYAARFEHVAQLIWLSLADGIWIISDRFFDSTTAYQCRGLNADPNIALQLRRKLACEPDLTIILDAEPRITKRRRNARGTDAEKDARMSYRFQNKVRTGFLDIAEAEPGRCVVVQADGEPDVIHSEIWATVRSRFGIAWE